MRLLVFGKTGQVARALTELCQAENIKADFLGREEVDLTVPLQAARAVAATKADIVINAAAYTAVDKAEQDRQIARLINAASPTEMAKEAARRGLPFLHISTDYVFDGGVKTAWKETDKPAPLGVYGRTKLAGETGVSSAGGDHAILRTAWVFSADGANFVKTMRRLAETRSEIGVVDDQFGGPTPAAAIAAALVTIARAFHAGNGVSGIYHFAGAPICSWADFATAVFKDDNPAPEIKRITTSDYPTPVKRPANSALDCAKILQTYGIKQPNWRDGLIDVLAKLEAEK